MMTLRLLSDVADAADYNLKVGRQITLSGGGIAEC